MIRRDYILRMIEEFMRALSRLRALKNEQRWREAAAAVEEELNRLTGADAAVIAELSETELLAKLMRGEPTQVVRHKTFLLTTLLKEAGDLATAEGRDEPGRRCYLKGLHLLLETTGASEIAECPEYAPKVEEFLAPLRDAPLPLRTRLLLMQHYERSGQFARAEDALFEILEAQPANADAVKFGIAFFERLGSRSDAALAEGGLPRPELEADLADLRRRHPGL